MDAPKRKLDEAQAETDETARVQVFRDHVALLGKLRVQVHSYTKRNKAWRQRRTNVVNISAVNSQVDEILDHIAALIAVIPQPLSWRDCPCVTHPCVTHPYVTLPCVTLPCVAHPCVTHPSKQLARQLYQ